MVKRKKRNVTSASAPSRTSKKDDRKLFAWLATFFTIIGFVIALIVRRDNEYVMYYAKQGLILFIGSVIFSLFSWIPFVGNLLWVFWFVLWLIAWINALSGEKRSTFLIGELAQKIRL